MSNISDMVTTTSLVPARRFAPGDEKLREALQAFAREHDLSRKDLGIKLGMDGTRVSKYITGSNDFEAAIVDRKVGDLLKTERLRSKEAVVLFETFVSRRIAGALATISKTNDFGLIFSPAGLGKTSAIALEQQEHPLSLAITAAQGSGHRKAVQSKIFAAIETGGYDPRTRRFDFIVQHLKGSGRLLMIDNGQRLDSEALRYLFDLQDETQIPICIFGNPEVENKIRRNDQMFSRIGLKEDITLSRKSRRDQTEVEAVVTSMLTKMVPEWVDAVREIALQIAWERGHFRALRKTITLAHELSLSGGDLADPVNAFRTAHLKLVRDYNLDEA